MKLILLITCYNLAMEQVLCIQKVVKIWSSSQISTWFTQQMNWVDKVFPQLENGYMDKYFISHRPILIPLIDNVDKLNEVIMAKFPGEGKTYLSADSVADEDMANTYPTDFLNSVTLACLLMP